jgi:hypothetical protein
LWSIEMNGLSVEGECPWGLRRLTHLTPLHLHR